MEFRKRDNKEKIQCSMQGPESMKIQSLYLVNQTVCRDVRISLFNQKETHQ